MGLVTYTQYAYRLGENDNLLTYLSSYRSYLSVDLVYLPTYLPNYIPTDLPYLNNHLSYLSTVHTYFTYLSKLTYPDYISSYLLTYLPT